MLRKHLAEDLLGRFQVPGQSEITSLVDSELELAGQDFGDPLPQTVFRDGPGEPGHGHPVTKRDHRRDALDGELGGELLVLIHVDLDQLESALILLGQAFEERAQRLARSTPLRPEINDYGDFLAALNHGDTEVVARDLLYELVGHRTLPKIRSQIRLVVRRFATVMAMESATTAPFGPVLTAVITPFEAGGDVDYAAFWKLVRHLVANGSDGVVVAGTTGESPTLSDAEKVALFKAAVDAVGDRGLVVAGTGTYDTRHSVELSQRAAEAGCHGLMAVTPYYSKPPQEGIIRHFTAIADATELPLLLYNIPGRTSRLIAVDTLVELAGHDRIVAVKDAVDDIAYTRRELEALPADFAVYSGSDSMTRDIVEAGGVGVVSVASHLVGPQVRRLVEAAASGDEPTARKLHDGLTPLFEALFVEPNPMPLKAAMTESWGDVGEPRLPLIPAASDTVAMVLDALEAASEL